MKNYKVTVNGNVYDVVVEEVTSRVSSAPVIAPTTPVLAQVAPLPVQVAASTVVKETAPMGTQGAVKIKAPMPGKILKIDVKEGQMLKKGEVILVLEAMKMENEIVASQDGTVSSIDVSVGISVESGDLLATLN